MSFVYIILYLLERFDDQCLKKSFDFMISTKGFKYGDD